jgi:acetyl/propionyl-CoA carboxylase alpha subunit
MYHAADAKSAHLDACDEAIEIAGDAPLAAYLDIEAIVGAALAKAAAGGGGKGMKIVRAERDLEESPRPPPAKRSVVSATAAYMRKSILTGPGISRCRFSATATGGA